jgi:hypothetical protein
MNKQFSTRLSLPLAIFGFMLIIATGFNMLLQKNSIPLIVSILGLILVIIAMILRNQTEIKK